MEARRTNQTRAAQPPHGETAVLDTGVAGPRLPALTGVRILAALAVYASHVAPPAGASEPVRTLLASGYMGVTLFFVLSGFVLAINYADRLARPSVSGIYTYLVARVARVYPLYLLILAYILVRQQAAGGSLGGWWQHVLAIQAWNPRVDHAYAFNGPGWSIGVEFFMYACFPLLIPLAARLRRPRGILLAAAGVTLAMTAIAAWFAITGRGALPMTDADSAHRWLYRTPLLRLGDFMLGILAALLYVQTRGNARLARAGGPLAVVAGLVTLGLMAWPAHYYSTWSWDLSYALPSVVLIFGLAVAPRSWFARGLSLPFMVLLGEASYAFYLAHQPALGFFGAGRWNLDVSLTTVLYELFTLGAILCLAVGLHVVVERPTRVWIRRLAGAPLERRRRRAEAAESTPQSVRVKREWV